MVAGQGLQPLVCISTIMPATMYFGFSPLTKTSALQRLGPEVSACLGLLLQVPHHAHRAWQRFETPDTCVRRRSLRGKRATKTQQCSSSSSSLKHREQFLFLFNYTAAKPSNPRVPSSPTHRRDRHVTVISWSPASSILPIRRRHAVVSPASGL